MLNKAIVLVTLYLIDVILNLIASKGENKAFYGVTKALLMPLLMLLYWVLIPQEKRQDYKQNYIVLALACHWIGDVLLLLDRTKTKLYFYIGMIMFFIGHISYSLGFLFEESGHSVFPVLIAMPVLFFFELCLYKKINEANTKLMVIMMIYSLGLVILAVSVVSTIDGINPIWPSLVSLAGVALFIASDFNIASDTVNKTMFDRFFTQFTYIFGQSLIVLGIALLECFAC